MGTSIEGKGWCFSWQPFPRYSHGFCGFRVHRYESVYLGFVTKPIGQNPFTRQGISLSIFQSFSRSAGLSLRCNLCFFNTHALSSHLTRVRRPLKKRGMMNLQDLFHTNRSQVFTTVHQQHYISKFLKLNSFLCFQLMFFKERKDESISRAFLIISRWFRFRTE